MIRIVKSTERGHANHGWLDSWHSFSFADYYDPNKMGVASLRVINDDRIAARGGFPTHPHRDMEIITYVLSGALAHEDSMGNGSIIQAGDVQKMSAGTGIRHSEFNPSQDTPTHLLQIWIQPNEKNITPSYAQKSYSREDKLGHLLLVAAPEPDADTILLHQDARMYATILTTGDAIEYAPAPGRILYLHVATGEAIVNSKPLTAGDAMILQDETSLTLSTASEAEILLFDLNPDMT
ncbi:MAG: pirin family protein [Sulfuriferula sp.]|nr:pirin family protein [Sulfuriferula sp.]